MIEHLLSQDVLSTASLRGKEYAWPPGGVVAAINDARQRGLGTIGGQAQFRLPDGTCEMYWLDLDPSARKLGEAWEAWVNRSADEAIAKFCERMTMTDWRSEIQSWPILRQMAESGADVMTYLYFVLYFGANPLGQSAAE